jgi:hypothetical protein
MQDATRYSGDLLQFSGWPWAGTYAAPSPQVLGQVGMIFHTGNPASLDMSWNIDGKSGAATLANLMDDAAPGAEDSRGLTAWWWAPSMSGMGIFLQAQGGQLLLAWHRYRADGSSRWLTASGLFPNGATSFTGSLLNWSGGQCPGCTYSAPANAPMAGGFQLRFADADHAVLTWDADVVNLKRFVF